MRTGEWRGACFDCCERPTAFSSGSGSGSGSKLRLPLRLWLRLPLRLWLRSGSGFQLKLRLALLTDSAAEPDGLVARCRCRFLVLLEQQTALVAFNK